MGKSQKRVTAFVDTLVAIGSRALTAQLGLEDGLARDLMREIAHEICSQYGRTFMYVPADLGFDLERRNQEIWTKYGQSTPGGARAWTQERVEELAAEYRVTSIHVYRILAQFRAAMQPRLPGLDDDSAGP